MKIFITGGSGFIGRVLVPILSKKHKLLLLTRTSQRKNTGRDIRFIKGDLSEIERWSNLVDEFNPDAIIHLAWEEIPDFSRKISEKNLVYGKRLISLAKESGCKKFLGVGTAWEYGDLSGKARERGRRRPPHRPVRFFVAAKRAIAKFGARIAKNSNMQFLWAIPFFIYGPRQKTRSLIPYLISSFESKKTPNINNKKGGNDFVYVEDVARALAAILEKSEKKSAVYNIGSGKLTSVLRIANFLAREYNHPKISSEPKKPEGFYADTSKIKKDAQWRAITKIEDGLRKTLRYYRKNG